MAYTAATYLPLLAIFQWSTPDDPNPKFSQPIDAGDTTLYWTSIPKDKDGATITGHFLMNGKNKEGYTEQIYIPAGKVHADGLGADDVIRGVRLEGLDYTTGDSDLSVDFDQDAPIGCVVSPVNFAMMVAAMRGEIGSGGSEWFVGDGSAQDIEFKAFIDHVTNPNFYWDDSDGRWKITRGDDEGAAGESELSGFMRLTTVERDALTNVPAGGLAIYNTTLGQTEWREGGAWVTNASGGTVADGDETTAGKWEGATVAEQGTATDTGATGAHLVPMNKNIVKASSGAGDENKLAVLGSDGGYANGFLINAGITTYELAENLTAGDLVKLINDGGDTKLEGLITDSKGTAAAFYTTGASTSGGLDCCQIDTDKVVVVWSTANTTYARVATVSGTVLTFGTEKLINGANAGNPNCAKLDTDKFIVAWNDRTAGNIEASACTVSGTTITQGAVSQISASNGYPTVIQLDTDKFAVVYDDGAWNARAGTVSGTTITFGAELELKAGAVTNSKDKMAIQVDTDAFFAVCLEDAYYCTVSGTTITKNQRTDLYANLSGAPDLYYISSTRFMVHDGGLTEIWSYDGSGDVTIVVTADLGFTATDIIAMDDDTFVAFGNTFAIRFWIDEMGYKTGREYSIGLNSLVSSFYNSTLDSFVALSSADYIVITTNDLEKAIGVIQENGSTGETKKMRTFGTISNQHTFAAADVGKDVYVQYDDTIDTLNTEYKLGKILSTTEMVLI